LELGVEQVWVGTWLQLVVVPPRMYVSDCPSISEGKVKGSGVGQRFGGSEASSEKLERSIRGVCQRQFFD